MNMYSTASWRQRILFVAATLAIGAGTLELVAGAMKFPAPESMAARVQILAAQSERAYQLRTLRQGELRVAAAQPASGI
jgi:hypothetical protein